MQSFLRYAQCENLCIEYSCLFQSLYSRRVAEKIICFLIFKSTTISQFVKRQWAKRIYDFIFILLAFSVTSSFFTFRHHISVTTFSIAVNSHLRSYLFFLKCLNFLQLFFPYEILSNKKSSLMSLFSTNSIQGNYRYWILIRNLFLRLLYRSFNKNKQLLVAQEPEGHTRTPPSILPH